MLQDADAAAQARDTARGGKLSAVLRIELKNSATFTSPAESTGPLRLRATLADPTLGGRNLLASACSSCKARAYTLTPVAAPAPWRQLRGRWRWRLMNGWRRA